MAMVLQLLEGVTGIISLVCFVMVVVQMFQRGQTGLGIACILLLFCFGIGALIAFIYGWTKAGQWGITKLMTIWTVCIVIGLALTGIQFAVAPPQAPVTLPGSGIR